MGKYQIQYRNASSTFVSYFYAKSEQEVYNFFKLLINAELTEIREVIYENNFYPKDEPLTYIKYRKIFFKDGDKTRTLRIPKIKKNITLDFFESSVSNHLTFNSKRPRNVKIHTEF